MQPGTAITLATVFLSTSLAIAADNAELNTQSQPALSSAAVEQLLHSRDYGVLKELTSPTDPALAHPDVQEQMQLPLSPENVSLLIRSGEGDALRSVYARGTDTTPPDVTVLEPNGGEVFMAEDATTIAWTAVDSNGIYYFDVFVSIDGGSTYEPVALGVSNAATSTIWFPPNRPSSTVRVRVEATDAWLNIGVDESDANFMVNALPGGIVPTTLRDFDMPGTQPFEHGIDLRDPTTNCAPCHGNYDPTAEPYFVWRGSMMANASRDPLFKACLTIANQDAPSSGDMCIRCHVPAAWTAGRSTPTDGSQILEADKHGVSCDVCHRMVDPLYDENANPLEDAGILADLSNPGTQFGNGMYVLDPTGTRRGPFADVVEYHAFLVSPFHQESAFCGTCHDVSNPAYERDESGNYVPGPLDQAATDFSPHGVMPIERTYSEWLHSAYNSPGGIYAPQFGGNKEYVSSCQDCHMRDVTGPGCRFVGDRTNMPLHDFTGGSAWMIEQLSSLYPGELDPAAQAAAATRSREILAKAATLTADADGAELNVRVTNESGHKLPTGYPEGRRMWLNVKFSDTNGLISESGEYVAATGELVHDAEIKIYEAELGIDEALANSTGLTEGVSFHFVLNNKIFKDNRIPPRGFTNAAFADFGGAPVGATYADGQYWDDTTYNVPACAESAEVTLYYQSTSKEYVEFLRDENMTDSNGIDMYNLWADNGKAPPEIVATVVVPMPDCNANATPDHCESGVLANGDFDGDGDVDLSDHAAFVSCMGGPNQSASPAYTACGPTCEQVFDADLDEDVDLADYQAFLAVFGN